MRANMIFSSCSNLKTAYYPKGNTTWTADGVAKTLSYQVERGKTLTWSTWDPSTVQSILNAQITLPGGTYTYTGKAFTPAVTVTLEGKTLTQGTDYVINYFDNINAGNALVQITGRGSYEGVTQSGFQIKKASPKMSALITKDELIVGQTTSFIKADGCQFESGDPEVASVTTEGVIKAVAAGTTTVSAIYAETDNYSEGRVIFTITVKPDPNATPTPVTTTTPLPTSTPGETETPGTITTPTPGAIATATPGAVATPTPGAIATATPGAVTTPTPGGSNKPSNPTHTSDVTNKSSSTPTQQPTKTKAPSTTNDGSSSLTVGSTVTYKNAKYRITGKNTAEFTGIVKGKTVNVPNTITVGGKVYKITSIAAKACRDNIKITKLVIGKNVKKIGKEAFFNCKKLKNIDCKSALLKAGSIKKNAFKGLNKKVVLKVPKAQKVLYKKLFVF